MNPFAPEAPATTSLIGAPRDMPADDIGHELPGRLAWFVRLRWLAAAGLAGLAVVEYLTGGPWRGLLGVAVAVAAYNGVCWTRLAHGVAATTPHALRVAAIVQIALDLVALFFVVQFTGGLHSPFLPFFGFHMAIGTILVSTAIMYLVAGVTSFAMLVLALANEPVVAATRGGAMTVALALLALVGFLFGIVYLTGSVSHRLRERNDELRATFETLRLRTAELEEIERRKSHYMRVSAHQLRSPLGTVRTALDVLNSGYTDPSSERGRRLLTGAIARVDGLLLTVNGLLDIARVREGGQRAPWSPDVNINQLLVDLIDAMTTYADERKVGIEQAFASVAVLDWGVAPDLVQAFENLIHNAVKYSHEGGTVRVGVHVEAGRAIVRVSDQGIGVPAEYHSQLFLEFLRAPNARTHAPIGTGLGLALVREVAASHGGTARLEPETGVGSTFSVELPLHGPDPSAVTPA